MHLLLPGLDSSPEPGATKGVKPEWRLVKAYIYE